jgi:hypothetical protein
VPGHPTENHKWLTLVAMTGALSMILIDEVVVSVALPSIQRDLDMSRAGQSIDQGGEQRSARIESLRALAAMAVLLGHVVAASLALNQAVPGATSSADPVEKLLFGGGYGVFFFFFALTGYLLFWPFVKRDFGHGGGMAGAEPAAIPGGARRRAGSASRALSGLARRTAPCPKAPPRSPPGS